MLSHPRLGLAAAIATLFSPAVFAESEPTILVTATRQAVRHSELLSDASIVTREEIEASAPLQTLGELLARQGGVESSTTGAPGGVSNIFIRGANGGHTLLLIDGQRVGSATLGEPSIQRIPLAQIERIEILRGPASALYGSDAIGGVIQIFTRPTVEGTRVSAKAEGGSFNTREASAGLATSKGPVSASLRIGALNTDGFNAIHNPGRSAFNPDLDGYENKHATANLAYRPDPRHELGASLFHNDGENQYDSSFPDKNFDFRIRHKVSSVSLFSNNRLGEIWNTALRVGKSVDDSRNLDRPGSSADFKTSQTQLSLQNDLKLPLGSAMLSVERLKQAIESNGPYDLTERTINSALAGLTGNLGNHRAQINLRHDRNSQFGGKTTGNLGYGYQLSDEWRLRSSVGTAFKAPTFNDLYYPLDAFGSVGNASLKPERSKSAEIGINHDTATDAVSLTAYRTRVIDLIEWQFTTAYQPANVGKADLRGLSFSGRQRYGSLILRVAADIQKHQNADSDKDLKSRARRHGSIGIEQHLTNTLLGADLTASGRRFDNTANTVVLAGYSIINLKIEQKLSKDFSVFAKANNVFDRFYELRDDFATPGRSFFVGVRYGSL